VQVLNEKFIDLITSLFTRGTSAFLIIFGRRETGKTDFSLLIAEILFQKSVIENFASNIKIYNSPFPIKHITNLDDLRLWTGDTVGKKLFIIDEFGKAMRRRTPMSSLNIKLIDEFQTLRKFKLSTIAVTVDEKYIDSTALGSDILDGIFIKPNYKNPKVAIYLDTLESFRKRINDIPRTSVDFDTWDVAPFKEHRESTKPAFKDRDLNVLWDWSQGKTVKALGLHPMEINRLLRKFVKECLETDYHASHTTERAATIPEVNVTNQ